MWNEVEKEIYKPDIVLSGQPAVAVIHEIFLVFVIRNIGKHRSVSHIVTVDHAIKVRKIA